MKEKCPNCKYSYTYKRGIRKTKNLGLIQRYGCSLCNKRFTINPHRPKMSEIAIKLAKEAIKAGLSSRKIKKILKEVLNVEVCHSTIISTLEREKLKC